ncbi:transcription antitermination factor NusB [Nitrosomonas sp.]|uniref:transcription antitermination factor NusB n=1 Tax=Nitrosomonas sp. TaxID=42353 RepID=UPI001D3FBAD6|nr:transcription antitermination factor NusB [Nitrosomonas sp.]MBX3617842.1 transcription antitermination factor NusB [Nitrosomonas sp.]
MLSEIDQTAGNKTEKYKSRRRIAREFVLQGLYQWRVAGGGADFIEQQLRESEEFKHVDTKHFTQVLQGVIVHATELEEAIQPCLDRPVKDLSPVEFAILLLSTYELMHFPEIPYRAIINEAIELARTFGGSEGHKYVNGVLDKLAVRFREVEVREQKTVRKHP